MVRVKMPVSKYKAIKEKEDAERKKELDEAKRTGRKPKPFEERNYKLIHDFENNLKKKKAALKKAPIEGIKKRWIAFKKKPSIYGAFGVFFSVIGVNALTDYRAAKKSFKTQLSVVGYKLVEEMKRDSNFKKEIEAIVGKGLKWMTFDRKGNLILTNKKGRMLFEPRSKINPLGFDEKKWLVDSHKFRARIDMEELLKSVKSYSPLVSVTSEKGVQLLVTEYSPNRIGLFDPKTGLETTIPKRDIRVKELAEVRNNPDLKKLILTVHNVKKNKIEKVELTLDPINAQRIFGALRVTEER